MLIMSVADIPSDIRPNLSTDVIKDTFFCHLFISSVTLHTYKVSLERDNNSTVDLSKLMTVAASGASV